MERLNYITLEKIHSNDYRLHHAPERILQFGEGNFLRGFVDYFVDVINEEQEFDSKIVVVQPIEQGLATMMNEQEGLYTLYLRGIERGEKVEKRRLVSSISRVINPYQEPEAYLANANNPDLRYIVSNTTEAGITFVEADKFEDVMPSSFPAKLTKLLYARYKVFGTEEGKGFVLLPCELIDNNGSELKACVTKYIAHWGLEEAFAKWVETENYFCDTLVDRIVTGYPREEVAALNELNGYEDQLIDTAEVFGLWVIEGPEWLREALPFEKSGLPVMVTDNHKPYKVRKVRILNGAHTSMVLAAYLKGLDNVKQCMADEVVAAYMQGILFEEIIPTLTLPKEELQFFAEAVKDRFENPYIDHKLLAIALNSVSKWTTRVLPSLKGYIEKENTIPKYLTFSYAALLAFYKLASDKVQDGKDVMACFSEVSHKDIPTYVNTIAQQTNLWGEDLTAYEGFVEVVVDYLEAVEKDGMVQVLEDLVKGGN